MLKTTLASGLQTLSLETEYNTVSQCIRPWIKLTPEYPFNIFFSEYFLAVTPYAKY